MNECTFGIDIYLIRSLRFLYLQLKYVKILRRIRVNYIGLSIDIKCYIKIGLKKERKLKSSDLPFALCFSKK